MKITINQKATERYLKGHNWIFRSDLQEVEKESAGVATVYNYQDKPIGQGLYSPKSLIALRMMTKKTEKITSSLLRERIERAWKWREQIFPRDSVYRLVFGEADGLPSLIIDRYDDVLVFQTLSAGMETFKETVVQILKTLFKTRSIVERNDAMIRQREGLDLIKQVVHGEDPQEVVIEIGGKRFGFNPLEGQKTGLFLDQRFNAQAASRYIHGEVLDAFSYVGQFAIQAASQATSIECVDASSPAIQQLQRNLELNQINNIKALCENAFDYLKTCDQQKRRFDTVCLDPPAFVKSRANLRQALKGYKEINLRAMRLLNSGGILVTSSCSQNLKTEEFEKLLLESARDAKCQIQVLEKRGQSPDHPWLLTMPETNYLKCYILRVE
jgi:23S rRNA (cytosine1962-C5)-methyltransferase